MKQATPHPLSRPLQDAEAALTEAAELCHTLTGLPAKEYDRLQALKSTIERIEREAL